jgi:hypothetical protein
MRKAGRIIALGLMGLGLVLGWFGLAQMTVEPAAVVFLRQVIPGVALIFAGVALEAVVWKPKRRNTRANTENGPGSHKPGPEVMAERTQRRR